MANSIWPLAGLTAASSMRPRYSPWAFLTLEPTTLSATRRFGFVPRAARLCSRGGSVGSAHPWPSAKSRPKNDNSFARSVFITHLLLLKAGPSKRPFLHQPHPVLREISERRLFFAMGGKPHRDKDE